MKKRYWLPSGRLTLIFFKLQITNYKLKFKIQNKQLNYYYITTTT